MKNLIDKKRLQIILLIAILLLVLIESCTPNKKYELVEDIEFKDRLSYVVKRASSVLKESECIVFRMDTLTNFDWDKMYAIGGNFFKEQIEEQIGIPWEYGGGLGIFTEDDMLLVFVKDKTVVSTVKYLREDPQYDNFMIGTLGEYTPKPNSYYYIYKEFFSSTPGFYLKVIAIDKDSLSKHQKSIHGLKIVRIDSE